jgi:hypothetical protein
LDEKDPCAMCSVRLLLIHAERQSHAGARVGKPIDDCDTSDVKPDLGADVSRHLAKGTYSERGPSSRVSVAYRSFAAPTVVPAA